MREILFRGKWIENGEWLEGCYVYRPQTPERAESHFICLSGFNLLQVDPSTVSQYTGLKDRNGVRIFEGDIIKTHYANTPKADFIEQVVFHNGRFCGMYERDKMKMWAPLPDGIKHLPQDKSVYMEWCEVIGNVHDNHALLEV